MQTEHFLKVVNGTLVGVESHVRFNYSEKIREGIVERLFTAGNGNDTLLLNIGEAVKSFTIAKISDLTVLPGTFVQRVTDRD